MGHANALITSLYNDNDDSSKNNNKNNSKNNNNNQTVHSPAAHLLIPDRSVPNPFHIFPVKPFPDRLDVETNLDHRIVIQDLSPIKEKRWFCHPPVYPFVIEAGELVPFCTDHHR